MIATTSLVHYIWNQPQHELDDRKIGECVEEIRTNIDPPDPVHSPDAIGFIYIYDKVLSGLASENVIWKHKHEIYKVMGELAGIVVEEDGSFWPSSRKQCADWACLHFPDSHLADPKLSPMLRQLMQTWKSHWPH